MTSYNEYHARAKTLKENGLALPNIKLRDLHYAGEIKPAVKSAITRAYNKYADTVDGLREGTIQKVINNSRDEKVVGLLNEKFITKGKRVFVPVLHTKNLRTKAHLRIENGRAIIHRNTKNIRTGAMRYRRTPILTQLELLSLLENADKIVLEDDEVITVGFMGNQFRTAYEDPAQLMYYLTEVLDSIDPDSYDPIADVEFLIADKSNLDFEPIQVKWEPEEGMINSPAKGTGSKGSKGSRK